MTATLPNTTRPTDAELSARFQPIFDRIAAGGVSRERDRRLAHEEVSWLTDAGFGALRVPVDAGGSGASIPQLFSLLVDLAAAESNLPQALRVHWSFVEDQLTAEPGADRDHWLSAVAHGTLVGNAITEPGVGAVDRYRTALTPDGDGYRLNGEKFYSTGSLYSDHILVAADLDGERVSVLVDADADGVSQRDDWNGFGQRLTVSGTTTFTDVAVDRARVLGPGYGAPGRTYATSYLQLVQLAVLAGIARRATDDVTDWVRDRTRSYTHAAADLPRHDPVVQQLIGRLESAAWSARALVLAAAVDVERAVEFGDDTSLDRAELSTAHAQATVVDLVLDATSQLFEVGGASIVSDTLALDRHWRNARTISVHNPVLYKLRSVGAHVLNGEDLPYAWSAGAKRVQDRDGGSAGAKRVQDRDGGSAGSK